MAGLDLLVQQLEDGASLSCMWTFIVKYTGGWFSVTITLHLSPGSMKLGKSKREMILMAAFWVYSVNRGPEINGFEWTLGQDCLGLNAGDTSFRWCEFDFKHHEARDGGIFAYLYVLCKLVSQYISIIIGWMDGGKPVSAEAPRRCGERIAAGASLADAQKTFGIPRPCRLLPAAAERDIEGASVANRELGHKDSRNRIRIHV
ncbi:hypothetical protein MJT46_010882 [Ovis ammon polii x Ovis aries]|nr:hypothetical protein MJT46_010882 [Ovis ammon polii x Ovis aries]